MQHPSLNSTSRTPELVLRARAILAVTAASYGLAHPSDSIQTRNGERVARPSQERAPEAVEGLRESQGTPEHALEAAN